MKQRLNSGKRKFEKWETMSSTQWQIEKKDGGGESIPFQMYCFSHSSSSIPEHSRFGKTLSCGGA